MQPNPAFESDFVADGELTVVHLPTGSRYFTYAASNPDEFYVLSDRPGGTADLCSDAKPILEQMLRRARQLTVVASRSRTGLFR